MLELLDDIKKEIYQTLNINSDTDTLNAEQVARVLDVKASTLAVWRCTGKRNLPFTKSGKKITYSIDSVVDFIASRSFTDNSKNIDIKHRRARKIEKKLGTDFLDINENLL